MTSRNDEKMTREQAGEPAALPSATTYEQAQSSYRSTTDAQERFEELTSRDLTASAIAVLKPAARMTRKGTPTWANIRH